MSVGEIDFFGVFWGGQDLILINDNILDYCFFIGILKLHSN